MQIIPDVNVRLCHTRSSNEQHEDDLHALVCAAAHLYDVPNLADISNFYMGSSILDAEWQASGMGNYSTQLAWSKLYFDSRTCTKKMKIFFFREIARAADSIVIDLFMTSRKLDGFGQHKDLDAVRNTHFYELLRFDLVVNAEVIAS